MGAISEKAFRAQLVEVARGYGWLCWYDLATNTHRRCPKCGETIHSPRNPPGWPDLTLLKPPLLLYRELKVGKGRLSPHQERWRDALLAAGQDWAEWRPEDMATIIKELAA